MGRELRWIRTRRGNLQELGRLDDPRPAYGSVLDAMVHVAGLVLRNPTLLLIGLLFAGAYLRGRSTFDDLDLSQRRFFIEDDDEN